MNTAQCKAFIVDLNTSLKFPDFESEIMVDTWSKDIKKWKRFKKMNVYLNDLDNEKYTYTGAEDIGDWIKTNEPYYVGILDEQYIMNTNNVCILRQFANTDYECVEVNIFTDIEDTHIVAFHWHID